MAGPITAAQLARDLAQLGVREGDALIVHSSLSAIGGEHGFVVGGEVSVIDALARAVGPSGTIVMPAFSADYSDPAAWTNSPIPKAWWPSVRDAMPAWERDRARTFRIGAVAEAFRNTPGVVRSDHPHSSFCATGKHAAEIVAPHPLDDPLGEHGPLGRLRALRAHVLLIGCGFGACTAFHLAEHETVRPPLRVTSAAPVVQDGARTWVRWSEPHYDASRFATIGALFCARSSAIHTGRAGAAIAHRFALRDGVAFAVEHMDRG